MALAAVVFLVLILAISHRVTPDRGVLMYGDYPYFWPDSAFDATSVVQTSFLGYVRMISMFTWALTVVPHVLQVLPPPMVAYLQSYGLLFGVTMTYFIVARRLSGSALIGYVAGALIVLNNVVLEYLLLQPSHVFVALIVYAWTVYVGLTRAKRLEPRHAVGLAVLSLMITHPFLWFLQVVLLVLVVLLGGGRRRLRLLALTLVLMAVLASYWLVTFVAATLSAGTQELYAGNQNSVLEGVQARVHHAEAFRMLQYPGDRDPIQFLPQVSYAFSFAVVAFVATVYLWIGRRHRSSRTWYLLLFAVFVVAMHLGLGPNSAAIGRPWLYIYENVPGAGFLRTFSRFLNLALTALIFLVILALRELRNRSRRLLSLAAAVLVLMAVAGHSEFFSGDLNGTVLAAQVPGDYRRLNDLLRRDPTDFVVMSYPNIHYEGYTWSTNANVDAFPQITYFKEYFLAKPVVFNRLALNELNLRNDYFPRLLAYDQSFTFYEDFDDDLNNIDVKYVLIHKDLLDIQRVGEGGGAGRSRSEAIAAGAVDPQRYLDHFRASTDSYKEVTDNPSFVLFENLRYQPRVRSRGAQFQKVGDATYRVRFDRLRGPQQLLFLQRFHRGWNLYADRRRDEAPCSARDPDAPAQCSAAAGPERLLDLQRGLTGSTLNVPHSRALGYANSWTLSADTVRRELARDQYTDNGDGSVAVDLVIYFQPQSSFYVGAVVSALALGACLLVLGRLLLGRRRRSAAVVGVGLGSLHEVKVHRAAEVPARRYKPSGVEQQHEAEVPEAEGGGSLSNASHP